MGPTSANCQPLRVVLVSTPDGKERLRSALAPGNVDKTMSAPVTAIFGHDLDFPDTMQEVFPHIDARSWFVGKPDLIQSTAFRNGTLQAAYFMLAARAVGLDCGPMSGFDNDKVDAEFFAGTNIRSNFLCNLGHGTDKDLFPRSPRFAFDRVCQIV
jgi:3-hydroxypropanoate dehydrogenase